MFLTLASITLNVACPYTARNQKLKQPALPASRGAVVNPDFLFGDQGRYGGTPMGPSWFRSLTLFLGEALIWEGPFYFCSEGGQV